MSQTAITRGVGKDTVRWTGHTVLWADTPLSAGMQGRRRTGIGSRAIRSLVALLLVFAALPHTAAAFFTNQELACDVHQGRRIEGLTSPTAKWEGALTYRDLCDVQRYIDKPNHCGGPNACFPASSDLYGPGYDNISGECKTVTARTPTRKAWPVCKKSSTPFAGPWDLGYRYPRTAPSMLPAPEPFQPPGDYWPICANANLTLVRSYPNTKSCTEGLNAALYNGQPVELREVGRCVASAHYYEILRSGTDRDPASVFYNFIPNQEHCPVPCASDVLSAVNACKRVCERYFGRLNPDNTWTGGLLFDPIVGDWRPVDTSAPDEKPVGAQPAIPSLMRDSFPVAEENMLQQCTDACGPPYASSVPFSDHGYENPWGDPADPKPPWVSSKIENGLLPEEKVNHWYFVNYDRWTPRIHLDGWMRSYATNIDSKPYAPAKACAAVTDDYCDSMPAEQVAHCKQREWPLSPPDGADRVFYEKFFFDPPNYDENNPEFGFCASLYRGRYNCPQTCAMNGNDSADERGWHNCGNDFGSGYTTEGDLPATMSNVDKNKYSCGSVSAQCERITDVATCKASQENKAICRVASIIVPAQTSSAPTPVSTARVVVAAGYYDGYGRSVSGFPGAYTGTGTFTVTTGGPTGTVVDSGNMVPSPVGWLPATGDASVSLPVVNTVYYINVTFSADGQAQLATTTVKVQRTS